MKRNTKISPRSLSYVVFCLFVLAAITCCSCAAQTESEEPDVRPTFTMEEPPTYPVLNATIDNPTIGDERDSLRIMEIGAAGTSRDAFGHYQTEITIESGHMYSLLLHVRNNAIVESEECVAQDVFFNLFYPEAVNGDASISALISSTTTDPAIVGSSINLHSEEELYLIFKDEEGSSYPAMQYDYGLSSNSAIATLRTMEDGQGSISGSLGYLLPGQTYNSGTWLFLRFRAVSKDQL